MPPTTTSEVSPPISEFYDRALLVRAKPYLVHDLFGQRRPLKRGHGDSIKFQRYDALANDPVPLVEGIPPAGKQISVTPITATVDWYGDYVTLTDKLMLTTVDPILLETTRLLGEQAGQVLDKVVRNGMLQGTSVYWLSDDIGGTGSARTDVKGRINKVVLDEIIRDMHDAKARPFTKLMRASSGQGTQSIAPSMWAICGPFVERDLKNHVDGFTLAKDYSGAPAYPNEIGCYDSIRFIRSNQDKVRAGTGSTTLPSGIKYTSSNIDVYNILIIAQDSYGIVPLDGAGLKHYAKQLGSSGALDPINQIASSGWKAAMTSKILNDNWICRVECGVTA